MAHCNSKSKHTHKGLKDKIVREWNRIIAEHCYSLLSTMPQKVNAVIKSKGEMTIYTAINHFFFHLLVFLNWLMHMATAVTYLPFLELIFAECS